MEQKTLDMFVSTCNYLNFLIDDIMSSNSEMQSEAFTSVNAAIIVNNLMAKLFGFMNHICKNQSVGGSSRSGSISGNAGNEISSLPTASNVINVSNIGDNNLINFPGQSKQNDVSKVQNQNPSNSGPDKDNRNSVYNGNCLNKEHDLKGNFIQDGMRKNLNDRSLGSSQQKIKLVPVQLINTVAAGQKIISNNEDQKMSKKPLPFNYGENKPLVKNEKVKIVDSEDVKLVGDKFPPQSQNKFTEEKRVIPCDVYLTKLFLGYTDAIAEGVVSCNNMGIYCHVCDVLCMKSWSEHVNEQSHVDKKGTLKKLKMYSCRICRICLYGSKNITIKYFEYHFQKIHSNKTDLCWQESLIETECSGFSKNSSTASSLSSLNKSESGALSEPSSKAAKKKAKKKLESTAKADASMSVNSPKSKTSDTTNKTTNDLTTSSSPRLTVATPIDPKNPTPSVSRSSSTSSVGPKTLSSASLNEVPVAKKVPPPENPGRKSSSKTDTTSNTLTTSSLKSAAAIPTEPKNPIPSVSRSSSTSSVGPKTLPSVSLNQMPTAKKVPPPENSSLKTSKALSENSNKVSSASLAVPTPPNKTEKDGIPTSSYPAFDYVLGQMMNAYVNSSLRMEVGYCTECQKCELSYFDWFDHVENHSGNSSCKEEICSKCGIHVYGSDHKMYFGLPGHVKLDKVMGKS